MADLFAISRSGLTTIEKALSTASHNIANANTEGFSRQRVSFNTTTPSFEGGFFVGSGVSVESIERVYSDFVEVQLRGADANFAELETFFDAASQIDTLLADPQTSLSNTVNSYYDAIAQLISEPSSLANREAVLVQAERMTTHFETVYNQLADMSAVNEQAISAVVDEISIISANIAGANRQIADATNPSPDLLDQRDRLIRDLSQRVDTNVFEQSDGSVNIFMSSGESLVVGGVSTELVSVTKLDDPSKVDVSITTSAGIQRINEKSIVGGQLGGLLNLRDGVIDTVIHRLGRMAIGIADMTNAQHRDGVDLNGKLGQDFFKEINTDRARYDRVISNTSNNGNASIGVSVQDIGELTDSDYRLTFHGLGSFSLLNFTTEETTHYSALPIEIEGTVINHDAGALSPGDSFLISPTRFAARHFEVSLSSTQALAAASPVRSSIAMTNSGSGNIFGGEITDIDNVSFDTDGQLTPPLRIEFITENRYKIVNHDTGSDFLAGPFEYNVAITNPIFPAPAVHTGTASGLVAAGSLGVIDANELTLNGAVVPDTSSDGLSTSDSAASGLAIAAAVNSGTSVHNVVASVSATEVNLGAYTPALITSGQFQVNGLDVTVGEIGQSALINAVNDLELTTGIRATLNSSSEVVLTAADGRNIQITTDGSSSSATFTNFDLTAAANDQVVRSVVTLRSFDDDMVIAGTAPGDAGFVANTY